MRRETYVNGLVMTSLTFQFLSAKSTIDRCAAEKIPLRPWKSGYIEGDSEALKRKDA
jgi:hypothetical protein